MLDFLIIAPTPFYANRGCHMRIRGEAEALQKRGRSVLIATYKEGENVPGLKVIRSPIGVGGFEKGVAATWKNIPAGIFLFWVVLYETIYRRPRVLYGHLFEGAAIGIAVKYLAVLLTLFEYKPILVLDTQGGLVEEMGSYGMLRGRRILSTIFRMLEKFILFFPDIIFTSSIKCAEKLKKVNFRANPVVLPDGISLFQKGISAKSIKQYRGSQVKALSKISSYIPPRQAILIKSWLENKNPIVLYTGSYSPAKGFPAFVEKCLPELLKNQRIRFLFGGGSSQDISQLDELLNKNPEKIISHSELNSKNLLHFSLLGDIAVDCKPSKTSESSGKILNYMAAGLPVVCFNQENNKLFLEEGGLYAKDYSEFTRNILQLADNPGLAAEMGEKNLKRAWSEFTWNKTGEKILNTVTRNS